MRNNQRPLKRDFSPMIRYVDLFRTIQGEGVFAGQTAVFIRLFGCNLQCPLCDTDYTSNVRVASVGDVVDSVAKLRQPGDIVVITGGEPFRQQSLVSLCMELARKLGARIQIETNGTLYLPIPDSVILCVSPKTPSLNQQILRRVCRSQYDFFKYVVRAGECDQSDGLPLQVLGYPYRPARPPDSFPKQRIFVQPADEGDEKANIANTRYAAAICLKFGYRLSLQTHKIVGLP